MIIQVPLKQKPKPQPKYSASFSDNSEGLMLQSCLAPAPMSLMKREKKVNVDNEPAISHRFTKEVTEFAPEKPLTLPTDSNPKLPQCLEMVN